MTNHFNDGPWADGESTLRIDIGGVPIEKGSRVRLHPGGRSDIMDIALAGRLACVEAVEQDFENNIQVAVVVEDDPGRDLGEARQPGHRFFFSPEELEPLDFMDDL